MLILMSRPGNDKTTAKATVIAPAPSTALRSPNKTPLSPHNNNFVVTGHTSTGMGHGQLGNHRSNGAITPVPPIVS
jgi:hypothetical protein